MSTGDSWIVKSMILACRMVSAVVFSVVLSAVLSVVLSMVLSVAFAVVSFPDSPAVSSPRSPAFSLPRSSAFFSVVSSCVFWGFPVCDSAEAGEDGWAFAEVTTAGAALFCVLYPQPMRNRPVRRIAGMG